MRRGYLGLLIILVGMGTCLSSSVPDAEEVAPQAPASAIRYVDQGFDWTPAARALFYVQDQGAQLIPLAWLRALRSSDGRLFLDAALARYGFLPNTSGPEGLPVGFTVAGSAQGPMAGMTCAACHVRDLRLGGQTWRVDGAPAFIDFQPFLEDLDAAVLGSLASDATFRTFATAVLGGATDPEAVSRLHADVEVWSAGFSTLVARALPHDRPWGVGRLDAMGMIYDRLVGLDLGAPPTYLIPENIIRADAPVRYPFLWNSSRQDLTQWAGFQKNGSDVLALARNLGQAYGIFVAFHPRPTPGPAFKLNVDYVGENSGNLAGLSKLEGLIKRMGPPKWPWAIDGALAAEGKTVFERPTAEGGCVECHGMKPGAPRGGEVATWHTPILDIGTDTREWSNLLRSAKSGALEGASIPGFMEPLKPTDVAINILKVSVVGAIIQKTISAVPMPAREMHDMKGAYRIPGARASFRPTSTSEAVGSHREAEAKAEAEAAPIVRNGYEARVLQGVWAAAPYLHNGSVPTLRDLLEPAALRTKTFKTGPAFDVAAVGLASAQPGVERTLTVTGCEARDSGDSDCGHEYGTKLTPKLKRALLEYLKSL